MKKIFTITVLLSFIGLRSAFAQIDWKAYYGPVDSVPSTNDEVMALPNSSVDDTINNIFILQTGTQYSTFVIALPVIYDIQYVSDLDALGAPLTSLFTVVATPNIASTYKLYVMHNAIPYYSNHRYEVIIAKALSTCTQPIAAITPQGNYTLCLDDSVVLNASVGANYTYEWYENGSIINGSTGSTYTAKQSGSYTVKVFNDTCNATSSATVVTINPTPNPSATITAGGATSFCQGGSVVLNASIEANNTYEWYKNGSVINGSTDSSYTADQSGSYTVKVINGVCNAMSSATDVIVTQNPTVSLNLSNFIHIKATADTLTGLPSGGTYSGPGVVGNTLITANAGLGIKNITYNYTSVAGCIGYTTVSTIVYDTIGVVCTHYDTVQTYISVTDTLIITANITGAIPPNNVNIIKVFPNPTKDRITINYGNFVFMVGYTLKITNSLGQTVFTSPINQQQSTIDLSTWNGNGIYFVNIIDGQGATIDIKKIILQ